MAALPCFLGFPKPSRTQETFLPARTIPPPSTRDASAPFLTTRCGSELDLTLPFLGASLVAQMVKNLPGVQET